MSPTRRRTRRTSPPTPSRPAGLEHTILVAALSGGIALAFYVATAARDVVVGDPTEFAIVSLSGGVAHAPGYPLLTIIGRVFALLPLDPAPFRVALASAIAGAAAAAAIGATAVRLGARPVPAILGALVFASCGVVWRWSVVPEAFALNDALVAGAVLALTLWSSRPRTRTLAVTALFMGLAVTNHQTALLIAPGIAVALWHRRVALTPRALGIAGAAFAGGLLPYLYVPIASAAAPAWNWGGVSSLSDLWALVTRQTYGTTQLVADPMLRGGSAASRVGPLLASYWPVEWAVVAAGAVLAYVRARTYLWSTLASWVVAGPLFVAYADIDPTRSVSSVVLERFFLLPHVLTAPLAGLGIAAAAEFLGRTTASAVRYTAIGLAAVVTAFATAPAFDAADRRDDRVARTYASDILASVEDGEILLSAGDDVSTGVSYLQIVEGARPRVLHVMQPLLRADWYVGQIRARAPELRITFDRLGGTATLRQLVEANSDRTFLVAGTLVDESLRSTHWLRPRGLVSVIAPLPATGSIDELAAVNDRLLARYRPPTSADVHGRKWEQEIRGDYARPAFLVGQQYELSRDVDRARAWYMRALEIDPMFVRARDALARLSKN